MTDSVYRDIARQKHGRRWSSFPAAIKAACVILEDCLDRRGIKSEFRQVDPDVLDDIVDAWAAIIEREYDAVL